MAISIPSNLFDKYGEGADAMLTSFGVQCKILYVDKKEVVTEVSDIKKRKTMNQQRSNTYSGSKRGGVSFRSVEQSETVTLRCYWSEKDFNKFSNINIPDADLMTIGSYANLTKIERASFLIVNTSKTGHVEWKFEKRGEPHIHGLNDNYCICFWKRA
jgi:hypothetical protein